MGHPFFGVACRIIGNASFLTEHFDSAD